MLGVTSLAWNAPPSVFRMAFWMVEAHCQDIPSRAETGGPVALGGDHPSLPIKPSRTLVKTLVSREGVAA